jgi:hypothetical protein
MKVAATMIFVSIVCLVSLAPGATLRSPSRLGPMIGRSYDVVKDFSFADNPNGPWSYGYYPAGRNKFCEFSRAKTASPDSKDVEFWTGGGGEAVVAHNKTDRTLHFPPYIVHPPNYLGQNPGSAGQRSVVRFIVPMSGNYRVQGEFKALDHTTTDPHVMVNGKEAMKLKPINSGNQMSSFSFTQKLDTGDTLDFVVGDGGNGYAFDTTGLAVSITPVTLSPGAVPITAPATATGAPPELITASANYTRQVKALAVNCEEQLKQFKTVYATRLAGFEKSAQVNGDLDGVVAARAELKRLNDGTEPTPQERSAMPGAISQDRTAYDSSVAKTVSQLQEKQTEIQKQYVRDLEILERKLTQNGNIQAAMAVRRERTQATALLPK